MKIIILLFLTASLSVCADTICTYRCDNSGQAGFSAKFSASLNSMGDIYYRTWNRRCTLYNTNNQIYWENTISGKEVEKVSLYKPIELHEKGRTARRAHKIMSNVKEMTSELQNKKKEKIQFQDLELQENLTKCINETDDHEIVL